ncbi:dCTP deaminase, dUMP-forming [uncultured archaeon]|nr:dCTP deaminase, dUMP-forming [uncultured archaeon]
MHSLRPISMALSNEDIRSYMHKGLLRFEPKVGEDQLGPASVDLTLDGKFWVFKKKYAKGKKPVDLSKTGFREATEEKNGPSLTLASGGMALGITKEKIFMPDDLIGTLEGRSRFARMGLAVHVTSALVQPGSENRQVLEIVNFAPFSVTIHEGMRISQIVFEKLATKTSKPYVKYGKVARKQ